MTGYYCSLEALTESKLKPVVDAGAQLHGCLPNLWQQDRVYWNSFDFKEEIPYAVRNGNKCSYVE